MSDVDKSCKAKKPHADAPAALTECLEVFRQTGQRVVAYKCRHCPCYHNGRNPLIIRRFIDELIGYEPEPEKAPVHLGFSLAEAFDRAGIRPTNH